MGFFSLFSLFFIFSRDFKIWENILSQISLKKLGGLLLKIAFSQNPFILNAKTQMQLFFRVGGSIFFPFSSQKEALFFSAWSF